MAANIINSVCRSWAVSGACRQFTTASTPKLIQFTPCLWAEPLKKKKRVDPSVIKARDDRRKKKLERAIRRLEKSQRQLKPIDELEVPFELIDEKGRRTRKETLSPERIEEFAVLKKDWARYMLNQKVQDAQMFDRIVASQNKALSQLRMASEELYQAAVQIDTAMLPFSLTGPVDTPRIENYSSPDGEYHDTSKKWQ